MSTLRTVAGRRTDLTESDVSYLRALVAEWQLLADLSFADLLLFLRDGDVFVTAAQIRMRRFMDPSASSRRRCRPCSSG